MKSGAEPALTLADDRQAVPVTPLRPLPVDHDDEARARLIRRLAADRLRDLRDDGVTISYMARMYDVETAMMEEMINALALGTR